MDRWLTRFANVAIVLLTIWALGQAYRVWQGPAVPNGVEGTNVEPLVARADRTLIIATRSTCEFCTLSLPFYATLAEWPTIWVAVGEPTETNRQYLLANGLKPRQIMTLEEAGLSQIRGTPAVMVVAADSTIVGQWNGTLSADMEAAIRAAMEEPR
jgi:hypothetical protein